MATITIDRFQALDGNMIKPPRLVGRKTQAAPTQVATMLYAGLLESNPGTGYGLYLTSSYDDLVSNWNGAVAQGLRICSIHTDEETAGSVMFLAAYTQPNPAGGDGLMRVTDWNQFMQTFTSFAPVTRLLDFHIHTQSGARFYTGTWGGTPVNQVLVADLGWDDFIAKWKALSATNNRLVKVQLFPAGDAYHLTGLFEPGTGGYAFSVDSNKTNFLNYYNQNQATMELVDFHVYDQAPTRWYVGVWRETQTPHTFIYDLDWGSFVSKVSALEAVNYRLKKAVRYPNPIELPEPQWSQSFTSQLAGAAGFSFAVAQNGQLVAQGASGDARRPADGETKWTSSTRMNLASVSKAITAVAALKLLAATGHAVSDPFYPLIQSKCPKAGKGVNTVKIADLLTMKSGMVPDGTLYLQGQDIWSFLSTYLQQDLVGTPGVTYAYSNTNFTILQAIISLLVGGGGGNGIDPYVNYVLNSVLAPMGTTDFSVTPDPQATATLSYGLNDSRNGAYWSQMQCVGAGGWIASAPSLLKFAVGVRNNVVLPAGMTAGMFLNQYGWYIYDGIYGQYFHHNGMLHTGAQPDQGLCTGLVHLADGFDAVLLVNSESPNDSFDGVGSILTAFEQRS